MKRFLLSALMLLSVRAHAAENAGAMTISPVAGISIFSLSGGEIDGSRVGTQLGASFNMPLPVPQLSFETGLQYVQAGAKDSNFLASSEYKLDYLNVPLGVRYAITTPGENISYWYARGGLNLNYLVSAHANTELFGAKTEQNIKGSTNSFDLLPYLGAGYSWVITQGQVVDIEVTFTKGLLDVFKNEKSKSSGWLVSASYAFAL